MAYRRAGTSRPARSAPARTRRPARLIVSSSRSSCDRVAVAPRRRPSASCVSASGRVRLALRSARRRSSPAACSAGRRAWPRSSSSLALYPGVLTLARFDAETTCLAAASVICRRKRPNDRRIAHLAHVAPSSSGDACRLLTTPLSGALGQESVPGCGNPRRTADCCAVSLGPCQVGGRQMVALPTPGAPWRQVLRRAGGSCRGWLMGSRRPAVEPLHQLPAGRFQPSQPSLDAVELRRDREPGVRGFALADLASQLPVLLLQRQAVLDALQDRRRAGQARTAWSGSRRRPSRTAWMAESSDA